MVESISKWLRKYYSKFVHSIGFLPAILGFIFLLLAITTLEMDNLGLGIKLNSQFKWLTLNDPDTARAIVSTISTGIISLTVFSFSMVMLLMNQAASQMSNRMLDNIIGDRVQKLVLSFYIGTIIFSLFLLTNISEQERAGNLPVLSVYFLLLLTITDIFLFVYFLHHITQSFRYEQLIQRIHNRTTGTLDKLDRNSSRGQLKDEQQSGREIHSPQSGYYQGFDQKHLLQQAEKHQLIIRFLHPIGTYVLKGTPFLFIEGQVDDSELNKIFLGIDFYYGQEIDKNAYYGFFHLTEVAVKALSPGINDPGTAVLSVNALTDLFAQLMDSPIAGTIKDGFGKPRIFTKQICIEELFEKSVLPIWDYGRKDRLVQHALVRMIEQLIFIDFNKFYKGFFESKLHEMQLAGK